MLPCIIIGQGAVSERSGGETKKGGSKCLLFCRKRREEKSRESQRPDNKSLLQSFLQKRSKKVKDLRAKGWIIREPDREEALSSKPSQKRSKT